jgi:hypothetical protein
MLPSATLANAPSPLVSLLSPAGRPQLQANLPAWAADLGLDELASAFSQDRRHLPFIRGILATLNPDPAVIAWRQAVLADFLDQPI